MRSERHLPPLVSLRAFEAVARNLSFRRAGEELLITQSAVSHHVRRLEDHLGVRLFDRHAKSISLTKSGEHYAAAVAGAFALIGEATLDVMGTQGRPRVRLSLLPSFAASWLMPRLSAFRAARPDIDLDLDPTLTTVDLARGEADLAIRFGDGRYPDAHKDLLMTERLTPVMSPALAAASPVRTPADLEDHVLLFSKRRTDWEAWAAAAGLDLAKAGQAQLTDYNIVLQAAQDGQGVALGRTRMIASRLASGALVAPFDIAIDGEMFAYWLLTREQHRLSEPVRAVRDWLLKEAAESMSRSDVLDRRPVNL